ncbi:atrial natriuretic peptide receptor 1-like [Paramacrobiotus metropolitanus]|uniref:atrial natriuretic peptide receptor 1-like n=1 Tax=Paramacrobiotus metropolitanus TaxID=2943436 RepID=UPI0024464AD4|nr:atrial natriuretic peptide receptor 1-like [Paramacrobiotus metropolitanus]
MAASVSAGKMLLWLISMRFLAGALACNMSLIAIAPYKSQVYSDQHIVGPAIDIAFEKIQHTWLSGCSIMTYKPKEGWLDGCEDIEDFIMSYSGELYYSFLNGTHPLAAMFGLTCTFANKVFMDLLQNWNLLLLEGSSIATFLADRVRYPNILGFSYTHVRVGTFFYQVIKLFNWTDVTVVYDADDAVWRAMFTMTEYFTGKTDVRLEARPCFLTKNKNDMYTDILRAVREAHQRSRIIFILGNPNTIRLVMLAAYSLGYTKGDHIFIAGAYFKTKNYFDTPRWDMGSASDNDTREAYRSLFLVKQRVPSSPEFREFNRTVQEMAIRDYNQSIPPYDEVNIHAIGFHDAILTYGQVANETLAAGEDIFDGRKMAKRFTNRTFYGIRGEITLDAQNNLVGNFELYNFRYNAGIFVKVVDFPETATVAKIVADIEWPYSDRPPPNEPFCGFAGNNPKCDPAQSPTLYIAGGSAAVGVIILVTATIGTLMFMRNRAAAKADAQWWRIPPDQFQDQEQTGEQAMVQSNPVTMQHFSPAKISDRTLSELKRLRTTKSDKLVRIFGILLKEDRGIVLYESCPKGSIYQVTRSGDSFMLEISFRLSMLGDLIEGLHFIHHSWIYCHGRLRSTKCLINSRFMVKITDYALQDLNVESHLSAEEQIWMAPELLRTPGFPSANVKRKADVYSFSIILSELCLLSDPYNTAQDFSKYAEIIDAIKEGKPPLKRPNLEKTSLDKLKAEGLRNLAQMCWKENPAERPTMADVEKIFQRIRGRAAGTMVDDLIKRMQSYADELEQMVAERTTELLEEKGKIQKLLFEILPRSVALSLIAGQVILPEQFESVTILFNAIEGFTHIASKSSPIQLIAIMHSLYLTIDNEISTFDVYKVETTNDVYLIASGLPKRNGMKHVTEIASCALTLRNAARKVNIRSNELQLKFVTGFHTGPIVTGVVGDRLPRYCLFGDTINTASRMESTSEGDKIQASSASVTLVPESSDLIFEPRGEIFVKGKGNMSTYWLVGVKPKLGKLDSKEVSRA